MMSSVFISHDENDKDEEYKDDEDEDDEDIKKIGTKVILIRLRVV